MTVVVDLAKIQPRRDTAANWAVANTVLDVGEVGYETDTHREKRGDGATTWNLLGYIVLNFGLFVKADISSVAFKTTGLGTAQIKAGSYVDVQGTLITFSVDTVITMPALVAGTNYFIYVSTAGVIQAVAASGTWPTPVAAPPANSRAIGGFHYAPGSNAAPIAKAGVAAGTAIGAQTVPINTWALYLLSVVAAGTITITPAAANATTGYASEAIAIAAMPAIPASSALMGYVTVQTKTGTTWVAGTDALTGGASGNVANATNYYPSNASAIALVLSRGTTDKNIASTAFTFYLGGDTNAQINAFSFWDLKWKPACPDPRGMTLVANNFWADIYLLNRDPQTNGTSAYNVNIADGETPLVSTVMIPAAFGGDGATRYSLQDWWSSAEALAAYGKRLPAYAEFGALAYGTTENTQSGTDPVTTSGSGGFRNAFTSKWGVILAAGNLWVWGADFGGPYAAAGWINNNGGRGQTYDQPNAVFLGGFWGNGVICGSRTSVWYYAPAYSGSDTGVRGVCDHLALV